MYIPKGPTGANKKVNKTTSRRDQLHLHSVRETSKDKNKKTEASNDLSTSQDILADVTDEEELLAKQH